MSQEQNMSIWNSVCRTNPRDTKGAKIGQMKITAICPQTQRRRATEFFGAFGYGWGVSHISDPWTFNQIGDTTLGRYDAELWYMYMGDKCSFPITSTIKVAYKTQGSNGYLKVDDEYSKKAMTDALTKGLSNLGFNSDVFEGKFDDSKYVTEMEKEFNDKREVLTVEHGVFKATHDWMKTLDGSQKHLGIKKIEEKYKIAPAVIQILLGD